MGYLCRTFHEDNPYGSTNLELCRFKMAKQLLRYLIGRIFLFTSNYCTLIALAERIVRFILYCLVKIMIILNKASVNFYFSKIGLLVFMQICFL